MEIAAMCRTLQALPYPGGVLDQPAKLIRGMTMVYAAQQEKADRDGSRSSN